jgi:hypothetical protein
MRKKKTLCKKAKFSYFVISLFLFFWFILRSGSKPSRALYPCQRAAISNSYVFFILTPLFYFKEIKNFFKHGKK